MSTKTPSIISTILTIILLILFGIASGFFLLVALNGFDSRSGEPALITSLVCNIIGIILSAVLSWKLPRWLIGKFNWNSIVAVIVSVLAGFMVGSGLSAIAMFISVLVADAIWNAR
ncbi:MAG: hypothetical protein IPJ47_11530 [Anaerolineales bacterium]|nr:hypothetical protein [Anaerolineales bacterium]